MWVQLQLPWLKLKKSNSPSSLNNNNYSFSSSSPPPPPPPLSQSSIHHNHSPSLKDMHTLFNHPSPFSPFHKHSLSFTSTLTHTQTLTHHHHSVSFKDIESLSSDTRKPPTIFHRVKTWAHRYQAQPPPNSSNKIVVYFTSLHVVTRTYEDCRAVISILKGYNVKMDERDLSMDNIFMEELNKITIGKREKVELPRVYVNGKYVGGVEEIRRLHESGELKKMIKGLPLADKGVCGFCGGFRFKVCDWCNGSHRVFVDNNVGLKICNVCNVNGLILCSNCTSVFF